MPTKPKTTGKKSPATKATLKKAAVKPVPAKKAPVKKAAAKPAPAKKAPAKAAVKKVIAKGGKSKVSPSKPASAAKTAPKAAAKSSSKAKPAQPASKAKSAAPVKSKVTPKAAAPKASVKAAKAKNAPKPIVKKATAKSTPAAQKPAAKTKPAAKAPAAKAPAKPSQKPAAKPEPAAAAKAQSAKESVKAAPPAPKRAPKATTPPPSPLGKMPRRRIDDEIEITIEPVKGPVKMTPWLIKQKKRLTDLRDSYLNAIEGVANETIRMRPEDGANSAFGMHQADAGSDAYDRDFALSLLGKEQDALYEINEALKRIEQGVYGICEMSAQKIPQERLEALPFTRYTVTCQERIERQQMGGRGARPVRSLFGLDDAGEASGDSSDEEEGETLDSNRD